MSADGRWRDLSALFDATLERPAAERAAYLAQACADEDLRAEVMALVESHDVAARFLDSSAVHAAAALVSDEDVLVGRHLGAYRIDRLIGAGGMGQVYMATDTRLQRAVALKLLPQSLRGAAQLRQQFEQEARAIAALRHAHICVLYDVGRDAETDYLVMEYLEGETLAECLTRGPLPPDRAIQVALEIADALIETHAHDIVHRDLKPSNIMLTRSGAKLLDFGLAKLQLAVASLPADGDKTTALPALPGMSRQATTRAGTLSYMSPEQLRGDPVDHRADLFAFGASLYEMLTGAKAFDADDAALVAAAVLYRDPLPLPAAAGLGDLDGLIRRCLEKSPADRWPSAAALAEALRAIAARRSAATSSPRHRGRIPALLAAAAVVVPVAVILWSSGWLPWRRAVGEGSGAARGTAAFSLQVGNLRPLSPEDTIAIEPDISPDGRYVVYSAGTGSDRRIKIRPLDGGPERDLSDDATPFQFQPRWSPDGRQVLYFRREGVFVKDAFSGAARQLDIGPPPEQPNVLAVPADVLGLTGATWSPDGRRIGVAYNGYFFIISVDGSAGRVTAVENSPYELHSCEWSPDGRWIACVSGNWSFIAPLSFGNLAPSAIVLIPVAGGDMVHVTDRTTMDLSPTWSRDGRWVYFVSNRQGSSDVYTVPVEDGRILGAPVRATTGLSASWITFSADRSRLVYVSHRARANIWRVPIPSAGPININGATALTTGDQTVEAMRLSSDRKWLLYDSNLSGNSDIFRIPLGGGPAQQLTSHPGEDFAPDLSPDGRSLAYHSWRTGSRDIFVQSIDGRTVEQVTATTAQESFPHWSPDGRLLYFDQTGDRGGPRGAFETHRTGQGNWSVPEKIGGGAEIWPFWSRNGRFVAYQRERGAEVWSLDDRRARVLYKPRPRSDDPAVEVVAFGDDDRVVYFKSHDAQDRASIWSVPVSGGRPTMLVQFDDPSRQSLRPDFAVGGGYFYFAIDERRSHLWVADVTER